MIEVTGFQVIAGRLDDVKKKYPELAEAGVIDELSAEDPSGNNKYLMWMAKQVDAGTEPVDVTNVVEEFHKSKSKLTKKDLYQYKTFEELDDELFEAASRLTQREKRERAKEGGKVIKRTEDYRVLEINSKEASCFYGKGTQWCITDEDASHYEDYVDKGVKFYFVIESAKQTDVPMVEQGEDRIKAAVNMFGDAWSGAMAAQVTDALAKIESRNAGAVEQAGRALIDAVTSLGTEREHSEMIRQATHSIRNGVNEIQEGLPQKWAIAHIEPEGYVIIYDQADNETDEADFPHKEVLDEVAPDREPPELTVYYITNNIGDYPPVAVATNAEELRDLVARDEYMSGAGADLVEATVARPEWNAYLASGDLDDMEFSDERHVDTIEPERFPAFFIFPWVYDPSQGLGVRPAHVIYGQQGDTRADIEDELKEWLAVNLDFVRENGYSILYGEPPGVMQYVSESPEYWLDGTSDSTIDKVDEREPIDEPALELVDGDVGYTLYLHLSDSTQEVAQFRTLAEGYDHAARLMKARGIDKLWVDGESVELGDEDKPVKQTEQMTLMPGWESKPSHAGPSPGDFVVTRNEQVTTYGPQRGEPTPGGVDVARERAHEEGRPNAPIWQELDDDAFERVGARRVLAGRLADVKAKYPELADSGVIDDLAARDPSNSFKYLMWMAKQLATDTSVDFSEVVSTINEFHQNLARLKQKDVNQYPSVAALAAAVEDATTRMTRREREQQAKTGAQVVERNDRYRLIEVNTPAASCYYGRGTRWCITESDGHWFDTYQSQGAKFYFLIESAGKFKSEALQAVTARMRSAFDGFVDIMREEWGDYFNTDGALGAAGFLESGAHLESLMRLIEAAAEKGRAADVDQYSGQISNAMARWRRASGLATVVPYIKDFRQARNKVAGGMPQKYALVQLPGQRIDIFNEADELVDLKDFPYREALSMIESRRTAAKRDPFGPRQLNRWMSSKDPVTVLSAARGQSGKDDKRRMQMLRRDLQELGIKDSNIRTLRGQWWSDAENRMRPEPSLAVRGLTFEEARMLSAKYEQDAFIYKNDEGVVGMYEDSDEGLTVTVPSRDGVPLFGTDAVTSQPRKRKERRRGPPGEPPEELFSGSRSNTFEFAYDWDEPRREVRLDDAQPISRQQVREQFQPTPTKAPQPQPVLAPDDAGGLRAQARSAQRLEARDPEREVELIDEEPHQEPPDDPGEPPRAPSLSELPATAPPDRQHGFAVTDLKPDGGYTNIMRVMDLASPEEVDYWANWYPIANREAQRLAADTGVSLEVAAGVIAVTSPGVRWEDNVALAEDIILRQDELRELMTQMVDENGRWLPQGERPSFGLSAKHPEFVRKALRILEEGDAMVGETDGVKGPKVEVFYNSMVDPKGTSRDIVLDGHAINLWRGAQDQQLTGTSVTGQQRAQIARDYRAVAEEFGLAPQEVQAITWSLWRAMKKHAPRPSTRMNLVGQLNGIDPDAVALLADLNGMTVEEVEHLLEGTNRTAEKDSYKPTESMRNNAKRGLEYRKRPGGKGGTSVGVGTARLLSSGKNLSLDKVSQMHRFFSRHQKNKKVEKGKEPHEDAGYVAWLLWGGDSGKSWAADIMEAAGRTGSVASGDGLWNKLTKDSADDDNPWAICTDSVGRDDPEKYERCVLDVKKRGKVELL